MLTSPWHFYLLLCWWQPTLKLLPTKRAPHVSKTSPLPSISRRQNLPLLPGLQFASWKPLQDNFSCIVWKFWVWQAMIHTFLWNPPKRELAIPPWGPAHTCQAPQTEVALQSCLCLNMDLRSSGGWCRAGGSSTCHWWCLQRESSSKVPAALLYHKLRAFLYYYHCFNGRDGTTAGLKTIYCLNEH